MQYLCLVYFDGKQLDEMSEAERRVLDRDSLAYDAELKRGGYYLSSRALQSPANAATVRTRGGKIATTDGPFAEAREQLGGFILIEARDLNEAIRLAGGIPLARLGAIEVRPIYDIPDPDR